MTAPWHRRPLHIHRRTRRATDAARLRAHELALGAWCRSAGRVALRPVVLVSPGEAVRLRTRMARSPVLRDVCPVCGRRLAAGDAPWCSVGCMAEAHREPAPEPAPDAGRGRAVRTRRRTAVTAAR